MAVELLLLSIRTPWTLWDLSWTCLEVLLENHGPKQDDRTSAQKGKLPFRRLLLTGAILKARAIMDTSSLHFLARSVPRTLTEQTCDMPTWVNANHIMLPEPEQLRSVLHYFPAFHSHVLEQREGVSRVCSHIYCTQFDGHGLWSITHYISPLMLSDILLRSSLLSSSDPHLETLFWNSFCHTIWKYIWHIYSDILSDILSGILSGIISGAWLRSGNVHWALELAVEVRQCPLIWS